MSSSKYAAQAKHIKDNYVGFHMNLKPELIGEFKSACNANGTTATTELKKFMVAYCEHQRGGVLIETT